MLSFSSFSESCFTVGFLILLALYFLDMDSYAHDSKAAQACFRGFAMVGRTVAAVFIVVGAVLKVDDYAAGILLVLALSFVDGCERPLANLCLGNPSVRP